MVEATFVTAVISLAVAGIFGAANSILGMLKNNTAFNSREFAITTISGIIAGIVLVMGQISGLLEAKSATDFLLQLVGLGLAIFGANFVRGTVSAVASARKVNATPS